MGDSVRKYNEMKEELYKKSPIVTQYGYDKPLKTRLGKSASEHRIEPVVEETVSKKLYDILLSENIKLKEEVKYLQSLFDDVNNID